MTYSTLHSKGETPELRSKASFVFLPMYSTSKNIIQRLHPSVPQGYFTATALRSAQDQRGACLGMGISVCGKWLLTVQNHFVCLFCCSSTDTLLDCLSFQQRQKKIYFNAVNKGKGKEIMTPELPPPSPLGPKKFVIVFQGRSHWLVFCE